MSVLVIDAGTSGMRALVLRDDGRIEGEHRRRIPPSTPSPGLVEGDARGWADAALELAAAALADAGPVDAVGIAVQRATTVAWDAVTGDPVGPAIGWQDLRTVGRCLELRPQGTMIAPNQSATKAEWLAQTTDLDPTRLRLGTVDTWLTWVLSGGDLFVTDATNAQVTGLTEPSGSSWDPELLDLFGLPASALATIVDSTGVVGPASMLAGSPPIAGLIGDQQASLIGQGCLTPGATKLTVGTGAMLDQCVGADPGPPPAAGTFPIIGWRAGGATTWAREAVMLAAGTNVEWLRDGLGLVDDPAETDALAASVPDTDGVVFVPALSGLGTPHWDHGARGLLIGLTRGTTKAHVVRAVLEGIAHRVAELVEAVESDTGTTIPRLRMDGGMSANATFVQSVADLTARPVDVSPVREATALGAGVLAGVAVGTWASLGDATEAVPAGETVEPAAGTDPTSSRARFADARGRSQGWIPELSALDL